MIDLEDLMTHTYHIDIDTLDDNTKMLTFLYEPHDYAQEFSIKNDELLRLRGNLQRLERLIK
jgi:hypothetical protein